MKEFIIFRNTKQGDNPKAPTHRVMATINNTLTEIGAGWSREGKNGNKFLSIRLKSPYQDKAGFVIVEEDSKTSPNEPQGDINDF
jgi:uncharacterized protein (DUF736 family)